MQVKLHNVYVQVIDTAAIVSNRQNADLPPKDIKVLIFTGPESFTNIFSQFLAETFVKS